MMLQNTFGLAPFSTRLAESLAVTNDPASLTYAVNVGIVVVPVAGIVTGIVEFKNVSSFMFKSLSESYLP